MSFMEREGMTFVLSFFVNTRKDAWLETLHVVKQARYISTRECDFTYN